MTDIADRAEEYERIEREACIRETLERLVPSVPQVIVADIEGRRHVLCYDCLKRIPAERLAALPHAIRCVDCQEIHEKTEGRQR